MNTDQVVAAVFVCVCLYVPVKIRGRREKKTRKRETRDEARLEKKKEKEKERKDIFTRHKLSYTHACARCHFFLFFLFSFLIFFIFYVCRSVVDLSSSDSIFVFPSPVSFSISLYRWSLNRSCSDTVHRSYWSLNRLWTLDRYVWIGVMLAEAHWDWYETMKLNGSDLLF